MLNEELKLLSYLALLNMCRLVKGSVKVVNKGTFSEYKN